MHLVWFKRDLRVADHRPLAAAIEASRIDGEPVVCVYVYEPAYWRLPDVDVRHFTFVNSSLKELRRRLRSIGGELLLRVGEVIDVFAELHRDCRLVSLHSHEETGNDWTFQRDIAVGKWCRENGVRWCEEVQNGVVRRLTNRDGWAKKWNIRMNEGLTPTPESIPHRTIRPIGRLAKPAELGLPINDHAKHQQPGGEQHVEPLLRSFLDTRGVRYHKEMSSPVTAFDSCSRISTHLVYGNVSMRQVYQAFRKRQEEVRDLKKREGKDAVGTWLGALTAYGARLRWHCHFMQKLEDQPSLEWENMNRVYDELRDSDPDPTRLAAWVEGRTGYPMVDACMRCVAVTGYLNFRMRAMVVSFASYHLWLHWREPSLHLARMFTDYEPGIHYSQFQMQSGTTGINSVRIYSPTKQVVDQDPDGEFVRRWVPELAKVPKKYLAEPEKMSNDIAKDAGCVVGRDYPAPIVEHRRAYREARERVSALRRRDDTREAAEAVLVRHGSRKRPADRKFGRG